MTVWQISESTTELAGSGEVNLVVTNTGDVQDRSVLTIAALDGAAESWFTVDEPQRLVPPKQTAAYVVKVAVPADTAAGTYAFQATAYSADRDPGESSTQSRRITLTVAPPSPKPKPKLPWPAIIAAIVVLVIVGGVVTWLLTKDGSDGLANTTPPEITGTPQALQELVSSPGAWSEPETPSLSFQFEWLRCTPDAATCTPIENASLPLYTISNDDVGMVLKVEVTAFFGDETASIQSAPTDVVASAPVTQVQVPEVLGQRSSDASNALSQLGLVPRLVYAGDPVFDCNPPVEGQDPSAGTTLAGGDEVVIVIPPIENFHICVIQPGFIDQFDLPPLVVDPGPLTVIDMEQFIDSGGG